MSQLNYEDFICEISERLKQRMGEGVRVDVHDTVKNNEVIYKGISVLKSGCNVSPNLRLEDFYDMYLNTCDLEMILHKMINIFESSMGKTVDIDNFTNFEKAKDRILLKLVSYEQNKERLKHIPHVRFLDLAVIYYYYLEQEYLTEGTASIQIEAEHISFWNIDEFMLHKLAVKNSQKILPAKFQTMEDILVGMMKDKEIDPESCRNEISAMQKQIPMYVLTNSQNCCGAAAIYYPDTLKNISQKLAADLIILPSSIHEVIILPVMGDEDYEQLNGLITEINNNQLAPEEILSNHLYYYDREKEKLLIPSSIL